MDVVTLAAAKADAKAKYATVSPFHRSTFPGAAALPTVMASPPTITVGAAGAAISIPTGVLIAFNEAGKFSYFGAPLSLYTGTPNGYVQSPPTNVSSAAWGFEFNLDLGLGRTVTDGVTNSTTTLTSATAVFTASDVGRLVTGAGIPANTTIASRTNATTVILSQAATATASGVTITLAGDTAFALRFSKGMGRLHIDGQLVSTTASWNFNQASNYQDVNITGMVPGRHRIRVECDLNDRFTGVIVSLTTGVTPTVTAAPSSLAVVGDSYSQPQISDTATSHVAQGWPTVLSRLTGINVWTCAQGGTGYINPGSYAKYGDRIAALLALKPQAVMFAGGLNDEHYSGYSYTALYNAALACFQAVRAQLPGPYQLFVCSPFWTGDPKTYTVNLIGVHDALKAAAAVVNAPFLDFMIPPGTTTNTTTMTNATTVGASSITVTGLNGVWTAAYPCWIKIGSGATQEIRYVTGNTNNGDGTWTLFFGGAALLTAAHAAGEVVSSVGPGYLTGTGKLGAPAGDGNADRYVGTDGHPGIDGHTHLAITVANVLAAALPS